MTAADAALGEELWRRATEVNCCGPDRGLLSLLREDATIYRGRGAVEAERLRAFVLECVAQAGLAQDALPCILEELETGTDPYPVAAAARAVRRLPALPAGIAALIAGALERIRPVDELVRLNRYPAPHAGGGTTATAELRLALDLAQAAGGAFLATSELAPPPMAMAMAMAALRSVVLEDQYGQQTSFSEIFDRQAGLLAFFYTRCMNPDKCSRTVSQLARVHDLVAHTGAVVAGVTYDPAYDSPERLRRYGAERGLRFGHSCRLLRSVGSFEPIREALQLGVGYGPATVNRHRLELAIVSPAGEITSFLARRLWEVEEVAAAVLDAVAITRPASYPVKRLSS